MTAAKTSGTATSLLMLLLLPTSRFHQLSNVCSMFLVFHQLTTQQTEFYTCVKWRWRSIHLFIHYRLLSRTFHHRMIIHSHWFKTSMYFWVDFFVCLFCFGYFFTCQVYEDVAAVIREEPFGARSAGRQPSSQNTQEVFYSHLKHW